MQSDNLSFENPRERIKSLFFYDVYKGIVERKDKNLKRGQCH